MKLKMNYKNNSFNDENFLLKNKLNIEIKKKRKLKKKIQMKNFLKMIIKMAKKAKLYKK